MRRFSKPGEVFVDGGVLAGEADALADLVGVLRRRRSRRRSRAHWSGERIVERIRTMVVLPEPLGPRRPKT